MKLTLSRLNRMVLMQLLCVSVLVILGCGKSKDSLHEMDHVTPPHWPISLSDAAEKIRERLSVIGASPSESGTTGAGAMQDAFDELTDLVSWVPEIAADTDLAEQDWNKLYAASEVARKQLLRTKSIQPELAKEIETLCTLLTEAQAILREAAADAEPQSLIDAAAR